MSWLPGGDSCATAVVTGASSGIGRAFAFELARRGYPVALVARRRHELDQVAGEMRACGGEAAVYPCDLAVSDERNGLVESLRGSGRRIDVLVQAAGLGTHGPFVALARQRELDQVRVMAEAIVDLCSAFAPDMARRRRGAILVVSSGLGAGPVPRTATYAATKAFCNSFGAALHEELRASNVAVTTVCPGPVRTPFFDVNGPQPAERVIPRLFWRDPDAVARAGLRALGRNRRTVTPGVAMRTALATSAFVPTALRLRVLHALFRADTQRARHGEGWS
jgi:uncharacterized protein